MSFLPPEEQNQNGPSGSTTANPVAGTPPPTSGGSTGAGSGAPKAGAAPSSGTSTQFGSSSSKLGDYLTANAPQITSEAANIAGNLNTGYNQIGSDINNAVGQFGSQVQGGYTAPNQDLVNQATSNPTSFVSNPDNVSAFQAQYNDQYTGPQNFESTTPYSNIQNEVNTAVQDAQKFNTPAGLQSYLAGTQTNPSQASTTLDQLLIQGNPQAQQQVSQAAGQYANLTPTFNTAVTNADALVSPAQQAAQQAAQYAQGQYGNAVTGFNTNLSNEYTKAQTADTNYNNQVDALRQALQSGNLSGAPGVDQGLVQYLQNTINPWVSQYGGGVQPTFNYVNAEPSNTNPQAPTYGNVATANDYATLAALNQLGGSNITTPLSASTANQAGTYQVPTLQPANNQLIAQDILSGLNTYDNGVTVAAGPYEQYLNDINGLNQYLGNHQNAAGQDAYNLNGYNMMGGPGQLLHAPTIA